MSKVTPFTIKHTHPSHSGHVKAMVMVRLTQIPFLTCQLAIPFLTQGIFQNLTLKIQGQVPQSGQKKRAHMCPNIQLICFHFIPHLLYRHMLTVINSVVSAMPDNGLAPLGARMSAGTTLAKFVSGTWRVKTPNTLRFNRMSSLILKNIILSVKNIFKISHAQRNF